MRWSATAAEAGIVGFTEHDFVGHRQPVLDEICAARTSVIT